MALSCKAYHSSFMGNNLKEEHKLSIVSAKEKENRDTHSQN